MNYLNKIDTLIFDLGGVIIDLHIDATLHLFQKLGKNKQNKDFWKKIINSNKYFLNYEKGLIDDNMFRENIKNIVEENVPDAEIDIAWNAMLGKIPQYRIDTIQKVRKHFKTFVLSNTNHIHEEAFNRIVFHTFQQNNLHSFFDSVYLSHHTGFRKPEKDIYKLILDENNLQPESVLFFDDKLENLAAAAALGIQTFHVHTLDNWIPILASYTKTNDNIQTQK